MRWRIESAENVRDGGARDSFCHHKVANDLGRIREPVEFAGLVLHLQYFKTNHLFHYIEHNLMKFQK